MVKTQNPSTHLRINTTTICVGISRQCQKNGIVSTVPHFKSLFMPLVIEDLAIFLHA